MEAIRFIARNNEEEQFARELNKEVRNYFKSNEINPEGDYRMIIKAIIMIGLYLAPITLILTMDMPAWFALILMVIMGIGEAGIGMDVMHDAVHGCFSKHNWINQLMSRTIFLLGSNIINWKIQHNLFHHTYTNIWGWDGDIDVSGMIRLSKYAPQKKSYKYQYIFAPFMYGLMTLSRLVSGFSQLKKFKEKGALEVYHINYKRQILFLVLTKIVYVGVFFVLPVIFTDFTWWQILIGFLVMHTTASAIMGTVFQMAHVVEEVEQPSPTTDGKIMHHNKVHQMQTTCDFGERKGLLSWYIGGLDFQVEHHLFPNVNHLHYPEIAPIVQRIAEKYGMPYHSNETFGKAFRSHIRMLKTLGN